MKKPSTSRLPIVFTPTCTAAFAFVLTVGLPFAANGQTPFAGMPAPVPGTFEAEDFDLGGEGVAYHDNTQGNQGGQYRSEDVDIFVSNDPAGGAYIVKNFENGEWLSYTIDVPTNGSYDIELRVATNFDFPNSAFHIEIDGDDATGSVVLPDTGGWDNYEWLGKRTVFLEAGTRVLTVVSDQQYFGFNQVRVTNAIEFFCTFPDPPPAPSSWEDCGFVEQKKEDGAPRASIVNSVARDGDTAVRLHTEPGDNNVAFSGDSERNDLRISAEVTDCPPSPDPPLPGPCEGREQWWAHSILFPDDFAAPDWHPYVIFDFHNSASGNWQANFHVEFQRQPADAEPGLLGFRGHGGVASGDGEFKVPIALPVRNVWYDFVYHVKWSQKPASDPDTGFFYAWVRTGDEPMLHPVLTHHGPTLYVGQGVYLKLANYHVPICDPYPACIGNHPPSSVIHDRVIRGTTADAVSPAPLGTRSEEAALNTSPAGTWVARGAEVAVFSGGTAVSSDVGAATATFTFTGTAVSWIGLKCNVCGIASVSIDGGAPTQVDTAGAADPEDPGLMLTSEPVFTASGLAAGAHTLVITVTGGTSSGGAHIVVDALDVVP